MMLLLSYLHVASRSNNAFYGKARDGLASAWRVGGSDMNGLREQTDDGGTPLHRGCRRA